MRINQNINPSYFRGVVRQRWNSLGRLKVFVWILVGIVGFSSLALVKDNDVLDNLAYSMSLGNRRRTQDLQFSIPGASSSDTKAEDVVTTKTSSQDSKKNVLPPPSEETLASYDQQHQAGVDLIPTDLGTVAIVVLKGVEPRDMTSNEKQVLESEFFFYLNGVLSEFMIQTQSVSIHKSFYQGASSQTSAETSSTSNSQSIPPYIITPREESNRLLIHDDVEVSNIPKHERRTQSNDGQITVSMFIRGKYLPPPFIDYNQEIKHRINHGEREILSSLARKKNVYPYFQFLTSIVCTSTKDLPINEVDQDLMKEFNSVSKVQITENLRSGDREDDKTSKNDSKNLEPLNNPKKDYSEHSKYAKAKANPDSPATQTRLVSGGILLALLGVIVVMNIVTKAKIPDMKKQRVIDAKKGYNAAKQLHRRNSNESTRSGSTRSQSIGQNSASYLGFAESSGDLDVRKV